MNIEFKIEKGINNGKKWYDLYTGRIANEKKKITDIINKGKKFLLILFRDDIPKIINGIKNIAK